MEKSIVGSTSITLPLTMVLKLCSYRLLHPTTADFVEWTCPLLNVCTRVDEYIFPFQLKPYVSYRVPDIVQSEFGPQDLFYAVYSEKIAEDYKNNKLDENCNPVEPSEEELLTAEEAKNRALSVGSDKFR